VRSSVRKLIGVTTIAALVGLFALAGVAGAVVAPGEGAPPDPGCNYTITTTAVSPTVMSITVTGAVGGDFAGAQVSLVVNGVVGTPQPVSAGGAFSFGPLQVPIPSDISVSYSYGNKNFYTNFCIGPAGESVVRIRAAGEEVSRALAFTGSSDTTRNVLIGFAALMIGTVLVVGTRRRKNVNA
jgi:hypothetical protein